MQLKITKPIAQLQQDAINSVNTMAGDKILSSYPMYKQVNLAARYAALDKMSEEAVYIESVWQWIESIRALSNIACVQIRQTNDMKTIRIISDNYETTLASYPIPQ
jgi:hypothetical protein